MFRILRGARFRILRGGQGLEYWGGGQGSPNSQQAHDVALTSMRRNDVASTSFRHRVPPRFKINQCQIITFLILKSDNIEHSRIDLKGIVLPVPSNQIKITFIIILPFSLVHMWFFPISDGNWRKRWMDYWGGGAKGMLGPLSNYWGVGGLAPLPPPSYAYVYAN